MTIIEQINNKKFNIQLKGFKAEYVILNPVTERNIFINEELAKNLDLGEYLGMAVILSRDVQIGEIIIGV
jgi:hypothetical protein